MKQQPAKIKKWQALGIGITILGLGIWLTQFSTALRAETEIRQTQNEEAISSEKANRAIRLLSRDLIQVTNERGLKATPKVLTMNQNVGFPIAGDSQSELLKLVTGLTIPASAAGITWEYVDINGSPTTPSSAEAGFQAVYIKITEKTGASSIQLAIPVNITGLTGVETTPLLSNKVMIKTDKPIILYQNEIKNKTTEELQTLIKAKANVSAWHMTSGEELPVSIVGTTAVNNNVGSYSTTFSVDLDGTSAVAYRSVIIFGAIMKSPYYYGVAQNVALNNAQTDINLIFQRFQTTTSNSGGNATYQWVADKDGTPTVPANTFDTSKAGFNWGYIKMTDKTNTAVSTVIPVPITVLNETITVIDSKAGFKTARDMNLISKSEIEGRTSQDIIDNLNEKLGPKAWNLLDGSDLSAVITDIGSLTQASDTGNYDLTFSITLPDKSVKVVKRTYTLLDNTIFGDSFDGWSTIPLNSDQGVIENPINHSKLGFISRGMKIDTNGALGAAVQQGFVIKDSAGKTYTYRDSKVSTIPFINGKSLYPNTDTGINSADRYMGIGIARLDSLLASQYYLKKGNSLKQILYDKTNRIVYVYDFSLARNLNFNVNLSMYNVDAATRKLAILENVDTDYYSDKVPIYATGNNSGFYMEPQVDQRFTIKIKDSKNQFFSDYTMLAPGNYTSATVTGAASSLMATNWFKYDFSNPGIEQYNYEQGKVIATGIDSAYQLGAPYKEVAQNEAIKGGYQVFAGSELPYMRLTSEPEEFNVYSDYTGGDFVADYTLASIPYIGGEGSIHVEYPNQEELTIPFIADDNLEFNGQLTIPRATLPTTLNDKVGTIKSYDTNMSGMFDTEGTMEGLPSNDYHIRVNVYNLSGMPIPQTVKKDSTWSKPASDLIKDPVFIPGNAIVYDYVDGQPDTSKLGNQMVKVRMTDSSTTTQPVIIEVPVIVTTTGITPTTGLTVVANNFNVKREQLTGLSEAQIKALILKESSAFGWDNATGTATDVTLSVATTTLTASASAGQQYTATIQGKKGTVTEQTTITITAASEMSAKAVPQSVPLGADESYWKAALLKGVVKDVTDGSNAITNYTATLVSPPATNRITSDSSMTVKVTNSANSSQFVEVKVPITVTWGNAIALGGSGTDVAALGQSSLAMTLQEDENGRPYIRSAYGNLPQANTNTPFVNAAATNEYFFQFSHIDMSAQATGQTKAKEVRNGTSSGSALQALGARTPAQVINDLGSNGKLSVNYGDVLKVFVRQGQHALYTANNGPTQPMKDLSNSETLFVVVTKNGFTPLYFNQLTAKEVEIVSESTTTTALYAAHYNSIANYFKVPSGAASDSYTRIKPNGFVTYPKLNLAVDERAAGSISVAEPTNATSNQYLKLAYNVTFVGSGPDLQIVAPLAPLSFGSQTIKSYNQEIKRTDPNWGFTVLDSRQTKSPWVIQAKMSEPFKTSGANAKELKGAELRSKQAVGTVSLNSGFQTIYTKNNPEVSNNVTWSSDKGFFLQVPPGLIDKDAIYTTEVEFLLTNAP
ncbi:hypothetical protein [Enterococcus rotai]|uniref:hypothetical protein n=1 Tax=Enterococcus rotai TaxID=118060 RepID=UPI0035C7894C